MIVRDNEDLAPYTTFGVHAQCKLLITVESTDELRDALSKYPEARILGGGSNVLVTDDVEEPVIRVAIKGVSRIGARESGLVTVGAGENWHEFVTWCVEQDLGGLENLALIPGTVGAAPMQNIGAYGIEQDRCFVELQAVERSTGRLQSFDLVACRFGYRTSVFKEELRDKYVIASVTYRLSPPPHRAHTMYKDVKAELEGVEQPNIRNVYDAVVAIRTRKLPDPAEVGNAGSFFKNPVVSSAQAANLLATYDDMPHYDQEDGSVKIPAAWLIDQCGWKGYERGDIGVHGRQALVLVNRGKGKGADLLALSEEIRGSVKKKFGVDLQREVNLWS